MIKNIIEIILTKTIWSIVKNSISPNYPSVNKKIILFFLEPIVEMLSLNIISHVLLAAPFKPLINNIKKANHTFKESIYKFINKRLDPFTKQKIVKTQSNINTIFDKILNQIPDKILNKKVFKSEITQSLIIRDLYRKK